MRGDERLLAGVASFTSVPRAGRARVIELAFPFAILSSRAWIRKAQTLSLEGLHLGIMAFMGLVCFGLIMIGADSTAMRDEDYRSLWIQVAPLRKRLTRRLQRVPALPLGSTAPPLDLREETRA